MMRARAGLIFITTTCLAVSAFAAQDARFKAWAAVRSPTTQSTRIYGSYSAGCIAGAVELTSASNLRLIRPSTRAHFGHPQTIRYIQDLAAKIENMNLPPIGVEDIAGPRGGPVVENHMSHQTGLDIDISLELLELKNSELETHRSKSFVEFRDIRKLKATWNPEHQDVLIATAANSVDVEKIFVAPAIKKHFCEKFPDAPWLFKLRAFDGHDDHIHVRLKIPGHGSTTLGTGPKQCGSDLEATFDGWTGSEFDEFLPPYQPPRFPELPKECEAVLMAPSR